MTAGATVVVVVRGVDVDPLMRATSACLAAVTAAGTASAVRALTGWQRGVAISGTVLAVASLAFCGLYLAVPAVLAAAAVAFRRGAPSRGDRSRAES
ncbi:hypothetical protein ACIBHX_41125 [Nonomuraea sp. NPDC050536]|uniref:hypothetical protein n=1 Tax=Nonomuraea sp. NPDC050536 TaxID=3364366 RepID=UPI0037C584DC